VVSVLRFWIWEGAYQQIRAPQHTAHSAFVSRRWTSCPALGWSFVVVHNTEPWTRFLAQLDFHRAEGADFEVGGRRYGIFSHDFRTVSVNDWARRIGKVDPDAVAQPRRALLVLAEEDFHEAVRAALRDAARPEVLAKSALLESRLLHEWCEGEAPDAAALHELLELAVGALDDKPRRAIELTYLKGCPTQEIAAERLGLPFGTYRRHLTRGLQRAAEWLWQRELHGIGS
jgi:DNA-directed RNA polymerase specialized sigma24 family protein